MTAYDIMHYMFMTCLYVCYVANTGQHNSSKSCGRSLNMSDGRLLRSLISRLHIYTKEPPKCEFGGRLWGLGVGCMQACVCGSALLCLFTLNILSISGWIITLNQLRAALHWGELWSLLNKLPPTLSFLEKKKKKETVQYLSSFAQNLNVELGKKKTPEIFIKSILIM